MKFIGEGNYLAEHNNSAYQIIDDTFILFDCGETVAHDIRALGLIDYSRIKNIIVILTHTHSDHVGSLGTFVLENYFQHGIKTMLIVGELMEQSTKDLLYIFGVLPEQYNLFVAPYMNTDKGIAIYAIRTKHSDVIVSYGYVLETVKDNRRIFYSGDQNDPKLMKELFAKYKEDCEYYLDCSSKGSSHHMGIDILKEIAPSNLHAE